ncbi:MAG TPA: MFS transporter [Pseudonocardiaceae bacterium]
MIGDIPGHHLTGAVRRRVLLAASIGNFVELYDYLIYSYLATTLARLFFPQTTPGSALLSTFAIFGVGFLARPVGAVYFGHLGDRSGRRAALVGAITVMGAGTAAIGCLPTARTVGIVAPICLLICRLVQGFAHGGEYTGANTFVIEYAPDGRRGRYASVMPLSVGLGTGFGVLVSLIVSLATTQRQLLDGLWRIPFLLALPLSLIGLYLRLRVEDSPAFLRLRDTKEIERAPVPAALRTSLRPMLILFGWVMINSVGFYVLTGYMVSYLTVNVGVSNRTALLGQIVAVFVFGLSAPIAGTAADRFGRKPVAIGASIGLAAVILPVFALLDRGGTGLIILGLCVFAIFAGAISTITSLLIVELFRPQVRYAASAMAYNMGYVLFGGTAPYVATLLVNRTGNVAAPGGYVLAVALVSTVMVALTLRETGNQVTTTAPHPVDRVQAPFGH